MNRFEEISNDPNVVFTPEYWGEVATNNKPPLVGFLPRREKLIAAQNLEPMIPQIITGQRQGQILTEGAPFNPTDIQLQNLIQHYPGTVLLFQLEGLYNLKPKWMSKRRPFIGDPSDLGLPLDRLLATASQFDEELGSLKVRPKAFRFHNGEKEYYQITGLIYIGDKHGVPFPLHFLQAEYYLYSEEQENEFVIDYWYSHAVSVGQTYVPRREDNLQRITHLEVCATGERVTAKEPVLAKLFGKLALRSV